MFVKLNATVTAALFGLALTLGAVSAKADAINLITNGNFSTNTGGGQLGYNTTATGWTTSGYNFLFTSASQAESGVSGSSGSLALWSVTNSPVGGAFLGADGAYEVGAISQSITGLTAGTSYTVSFYWGGAQQSGFTGTTTEQWLVSLGSQQLATSVLTDASQGFTGWQYTSLTFTATSSSEVLSFLAAGTPNGEPPFSLLDGVTMYANVPEPATWTLMFMGVIGIAGARRWTQSRR